MKICNAMAWKDDLQARLKKERAQILQGLEWLKTGKLDVGNVSSTGRLESHRTELLDQYRGILAELDRTIADLEREGPDMPKGPRGEKRPADVIGHERSSDGLLPEHESRWA